VSAVPPTHRFRLGASSRRALRRLLPATLLTLPIGAALAVAQVPGTAPRSLDSPASTAQLTWTAPASITEEQRTSLNVSGEIDGQATGHVALVEGVGACPASPLYPRQIATGTKLNLTPIPVVTPALTTPSPTPAPTTTTPEATTPTTPTPTPTPSAPTSGRVDQALTLTEKNSGTYRLCGWVVASPASSEASTIARFDQPVVVANRASTLTAEIPDTARSGDYFSVKVTGTTPAAGRRLLVMAEPDKGQQCGNLRKAAAGKRPLQTIVGVPSGAFSKVLKLRYRTKTAGPHLLCIQVVEASDRNPEALQSRTMAVTESLKCVNTQTAIAQRRRDLDVIRGRRDAAQQRLAAAKKKLAPLRKSYAAAKRASDRRIASAQKAVKKAKSAAGKRKARKRLAAVRRTEAARLRRAGAPLRKAQAAIKVQERTYRQYRTGANLLNDTIGRMKKDTKKYCAKPSA
jgi:hypothetical protein